MELSYLNVLEDILENGETRADRTGVGTISVFGRQMRFNLAKAFPAVTTKKLAFDSVVSEDLFFVEGSSDERRLCEIRHGTRDASKKTIWTGNAQADYWKPKARFDGDLGRVYGVQWRDWRSYKIKSCETSSTIRRTGTRTFTEATVEVTSHDQLANIIETIKNNPTDRRMLLSAMNIGEMDQMALPPCHMFAQFYVNIEKQTLSCQMYQRSADMFLGVPFNIASYAILTHMIAQVTGLGVGELIINIGDAHIYSNHVEQVKEQLSRTPFDPPQLWINPDVKSIDGFTMADFRLVGYQHHPEIKGAMAV